MNLEKFSSTYGNSYTAYQAAKWLQRNSPETVQRLSQDIHKFEDSLNKEHQAALNKCPHCEIDFSPADVNTVECSRCGLADNQIILKDYHKYTDSYSAPSKQTFDQEKHLNLQIGSTTYWVLQSLQKIFCRC